MSTEPSEFAYVVRKSGAVQITHRGRVATTLRGPAAERFLVDVAEGDRQQLMARVTRNYKRGNERLAKGHPRNRDR